MAKKLWVLFVLLVLLGGSLPAQQFPPGFVDPQPLLAAAAKEIGEANLRCVTFSGTGYAGAVGQTFEQNPNIDWKRQEMANYTRSINFETGVSKETFDRKPGENPAAYKYGLGWQDGTPTQKNVRQTFVTNGKRSWAMDGDGPAIEASPEDAERWQLDMWLNPAGFLKAARLPGANPRAFWRWEQLEMGRDGNVVNLKKMHVVAITMLGKYKVDATINQQNQIQRLHVMVNEPALGDFNIEHESTNQQQFGNVKWPTNWHSHQGWDDNYQFANLSTGHNAYGGNFSKVEPHVCPDGVAVPANLQPAMFPNPSNVTVEKLANGVYLLGGGPANSYMVEFKDWVTVFEAPTNEKRSLAVIEEVVKLAPNKPIRWLVSSHVHFDHIGGLRTYLHIGSTIITSRKNIEFLNHEVLNYRAQLIEPDITSQWPPTELAEGYNFEAINENYVITDNSRILRVYYVQPLQHAAGMLMAYLPQEKIAFEANLFDTHEAPPANPTPAMRSFWNQVQRMSLDITTIAPVHGKPVPWSTFQKAMGAAGTNVCARVGSGGSTVMVPCNETQ
jgi:glyoxylase-like metal-dependent hydrolase (beta-lactamase superfamily II)